jgi:hypothetical protein
MAGSWLKYELEVKYTDTTSGYIYFWENNINRIFYEGSTDGYAGSNRCEAIGGFLRSHASTNFLYFGDIYYDQDPKRFMLTNHATYASSTIMEPQPYTAWSTSSVSLTCNAGALSNGTVHLHFRNSVGESHQYIGSFTLSDSGGAPASAATLMPQIAL